MIEILPLDPYTGLETLPPASLDVLYTIPPSRTPIIRLAELAYRTLAPDRVCWLAVPVWEDCDWAHGLRTAGFTRIMSIHVRLPYEIGTNGHIRCASRRLLLVHKGDPTGPLNPIQDTWSLNGKQPYLNLAQRALACYAPESEPWRICDPFPGRGDSLVACERLRYHGTFFAAAEETYSRLHKRLAEERQQLCLPVD